jgi:tryptophan halogenase
MAIPDSLTEKIERFRHRAHIREYRDGLFGPASWQAVFIGQGILPGGQEAMADLMPDAVLAERMAGLKALIARTAGAMPEHSATVARHAPAGAA